MSFLPGGVSADGRLVAFAVDGVTRGVFVTPGGATLTCLSAPVQTFPPLARGATLPADLPPTPVPRL